MQLSLKNIETIQKYLLDKFMKFVLWWERQQKSFGLNGRTFEREWIFLHRESDDNYYISLKSFY